LVVFGVVTSRRKPERSPRVTAVENKQPDLPHQPLFDRAAPPETLSDVRGHETAANTSKTTDAASSNAVNLSKAEKNDALRRSIMEEPRDPGWSPGSERFLSILLAEEPFRIGRIRELTCGTTRCGFAVDGIPVSALAGNPVAYSDSLRKRLFERFPTVRTFTSEPENGHVNVQVIAAREGYSLRGRTLAPKK
jgi:hypothetical protein